MSATIQLVGNIGSEPRIVETAKGKVCNVFFLVNQGKDKEPIAFDIAVWENDYTKNTIPHLKKGAKVLFTGELAPPSIYETKEGKKKVKSSLSRIHTILLLKKPEEGGK